MTNVIVFPKLPPQHKLQSLDQILEQVEENKKEHINYLMEDISNFIYGIAMDAGFDIDQDELFKDSVLVTEGIRSMLCKSVGIEHPLQDIVKDLISFDREEGESPTVA